MLNVATLTHEPTTELTLADKLESLSATYKRHYAEFTQHLRYVEKSAWRSYLQLRETKKQPWYYWLFGAEKNISNEDINRLRSELNHIKHSLMFATPEPKSLPLEEIEFPEDRAEANKMAVALINRDIYKFRNRAKYVVNFFKSEIEKLVDPKDDDYQRVSIEKDLLVRKFERHVDATTCRYKSLPALYVVARHHRLPTPY